MEGHNNTSHSLSQVLTDKGEERLKVEVRHGYLRVRSTVLLPEPSWCSVFKLEVNQSQSQWVLMVNRCPPWVHSRCLKRLIIRDLSNFSPPHLKIRRISPYDDTIPRYPSFGLFGSSPSVRRLHPLQLDPNRVPISERSLVFRRDEPGLGSYRVRIVGTQSRRVWRTDRISGKVEVTHWTWSSYGFRSG